MKRQTRSHQRLVKVVRYDAMWRASERWYHAANLPQRHDEQIVMASQENMTIKSKSVVIAAAAVVLVAIVGLFYFRGSWSCVDGTWVATGHPLSRHPQTVCVKPEPPQPPPTICSPAWSCGRLSRGETGMKTDVWYLKYDDLTGPEQLEIVFKDDAICRVDGIVADCARMNPPNRSDSSFNGIKEGDVFIVSSLEFKTK